MGLATRFTRYVLFCEERQKFYCGPKSRPRWTDDVQKAKAYHRASDAKRATTQGGAHGREGRHGVFTTWKVVPITCVLHEEDLS